MTGARLRWAPVILFRYAPHYGIIMHTSYLPTGQRSHLKEVIQMQISSDINPRRRRDNQFFLSCFTRSACSFVFIYFTFLVLFFAFQGVFLLPLLIFLLLVALLFKLPPLIWRSTVDSRSFACPRGDVFDNRR